MNIGISGMKMLTSKEWRELPPEQQWDAFAVLQDDYDAAGRMYPALRMMRETRVQIVDGTAAHTTRDIFGS